MTPQRKRTQYDAERLDLEEVGKYLRNQGYDVGQLKQPWRHVVGKVKRKGQDLFFKMASTDVIGVQTRNEFTGMT